MNSIRADAAFDWKKRPGTLSYSRNHERPRQNSGRARLDNRRGGLGNLDGIRQKLARAITGRHSLRQRKLQLSISARDLSVDQRDSESSPLDVQKITAVSFPNGGAIWR